MKDILLHNGHIKIYKRENSKFWQMRIKPPKEKAFRESSGCKSLKDAKEIALKKYNDIISKKTFVVIPKNAQHIFNGIFSFFYSFFL